MQEAIELVGASIILLSIFVGIASPLIVLIICLFYYFKKRLEHKQIMAAIEKGASLSELKLPKPAGSPWIKNLTAGIALLIISAGLVCLRLVQGYDHDESFGFYFFALIFFAIGISRLIRGLLQRKAQKQFYASNTANHSTKQAADASPDMSPQSPRWTKVN